MGPQTREMRPARGASSNHVDDATTPIVLRDALTGLTEAMGWYEAGIILGVTMGRQQIVDEWRGRMEAGAAVARMIASHGPYDELAERRVQPERAARQRAILRDRGIA